MQRMLIKLAKKRQTCISARLNDKNFLSLKSLAISCRQKYSRLRCLLLVKGVLICFYLGWSGSALPIRKVSYKTWLLAAVWF